MISICIGKKGSGKTALVRKLAARGLLQRSPVFYHDPQAQIDHRTGRVYPSTAAWVADPRPPYLSVFRSVDIEDVAALALKVRNITVVIDEMDRAFADKRWLSPSVKRIVHEGRHFRVSLLGTFRRTANVSEDLLSQCDYAFLFKTSSASPYDLQTIEKRFGESYAREVQTLGDGEYIIWSDRD